MVEPSVTAVAFNSKFELFIPTSKFVISVIAPVFTTDESVTPALTVLPSVSIPWLVDNLFITNSVFVISFCIM